MKIPQSAKLVLKVRSFDVYQWDGKCTTDRMKHSDIKTSDTTQVIAAYDGKIIIAEQQPQRPSAYFTLFGGRVENDEESLAAAKQNSWRRPAWHQTIGNCGAPTNRLAKWNGQSIPTLPEIVRSKNKTWTLVKNYS